VSGEVAEAGRRKVTVKTWLSLGWIVALAAAGCSGAAGLRDTTPDGRLSVVATHSILGDLVANVGGDRLTVRTLVGPQGDAHDFEPRPADAAAVADAAVVFENGLGFELWLDKLYAASDSAAVRVVATDGIAPLPVAERGAEGGPGGGGKLDPHVWHDVTKAIRIVENVRAALLTADPSNARIYTANAEAYIAQLSELDTWVREQVGRLPPERRLLVTPHDTFGYFAARYGFVVVGTALGGTTAGLADPSAGTIAELVEAIKSAGVRAIFVENVSNPGLMQQIAADAGVELAPSLYTDALGEPGSAGDSYVKMIRYNVSTIVDALRTYPRTP